MHVTLYHVENTNYRKQKSNPFQSQHSSPPRYSSPPEFSTSAHNSATSDRYSENTKSDHIRPKQKYPTDSSTLYHSDQTLGLKSSFHSSQNTKRSRQRSFSPTKDYSVLSSGSDVSLSDIEEENSIQSPQHMCPTCGSVPPPSRPHSSPDKFSPRIQSPSEESVTHSNPEPFSPRQLSFSGKSVSLSHISGTESRENSEYLLRKVPKKDREFSAEYSEVSKQISDLETPSHRTLSQKELSFGTKYSQISLSDHSAGGYKSFTQQSGSVGGSSQQHYKILPGISEHPRSYFRYSSTSGQDSYNTQEYSSEQNHSSEHFGTPGSHSQGSQRSEYRVSNASYSSNRSREHSGRSFSERHSGYSSGHSSKHSDFSRKHSPGNYQEKFSEVGLFSKRTCSLMLCGSL